MPVGFDVSVAVLDAPPSACVMDPASDWRGVGRAAIKEERIFLVVGDGAPDTLTETEVVREAALVEDASAAKIETTSLATELRKPSRESALED